MLRIEACSNGWFGARRCFVHSDAHMEELQNSLAGLPGAFGLGVGDINETTAEVLVVALGTPYESQHPNKR